MVKGSFQRRWALVIISVLLLSVCALSAYGKAKGKEAAAPMADSGRTDIVLIDSMKVFGDLERPAVLFLHDRHTEALAKQGKDCSVCHLQDQDKPVWKYKRLQDTDKKTVTEIYHTNCIACHKETTAAGAKSGPVTCGECHRKEITVADAHVPYGFDLSLHARHSKALEKKCETCHHAYNAETKKLYYAKGEEGTCRYCHGKVKEENRISFREASHLGCIDCHQKTMAKKKDTGPVQCGGCHDAEMQGMIAKLKPVPRMQANQPDATLVQKHSKDLYASLDMHLKPQMAPVPFNHKAHEGANDTCRVCHHASIKKPCNDCHTLAGAQKGNGINLMEAMHGLGNDQSCIGCHTNYTKKSADCAGCHGALADNRTKSEASCLSCHQGLPYGTSAIDQPLPKEQAALMAAEMLAARRPVRETYALEDIPDIVKIGALSNRYEPAELPHRKIVLDLLKRTRDNQLAAYFHQDPGTLCQGCHHNSPPATKPPRCGSCHAKTFNAQDLVKPGLMAAYHDQCIGCHDRMGIAKPAANDCAGCHKERNR